ncbi:Sedlin [Hyaloraphidium curvatum]|nr:Sedlin [Hyaloraphidium curvatum]
MSYFAIVGTRDGPIFEADFGPTRPDVPARMKEENKHLNQFIVHAALDMVDEIMWNTKEMYLKTVDKFNEWFVSAYVTATGMRFMLLHEALKSDDIKNFFFECHELYLKTLLNPLYDINAPILSPMFETKVRALHKKYLT